MTDPGAIENAAIDARIAARLETLDVGAELRAEGMTTVYMDAEGRLVEHRPDGTTTVLE
jgi:hypothetical protein